MPLYFFECKKSHLFEVNVSYETMKAGIPCKQKRCKAIAKWCPMSRGAAQAARHFAPSLLYVRADGDIIMPGRNDPAHLPKGYRNSIQRKGYKEVQITNFREYEHFQKSISEKLQARAEAYNAAEQSAYDIAVKEQIASLRRGGRVELPNENGKGSRIIDMPPLDKLDHPQIRRLAEHAIKQLESYKFKSSPVNPFLNAMENDSVKWEDVETGFRRRS